jgi:dihydrofolate reductase
MGLRKLSAHLFYSLDGVVEAPDKWSFDTFSDEQEAAMKAAIDKEDAIILGRRTYQEWSEFWPKNTQFEPFASHINKKPKYVVTKTLKETPWGDFGNAKVLKGDLVKEITALKNQSGKDIGTGGSPTLVRFLLQKGLLDTLTLSVYPVVVGHGNRLFPEGEGLRRLKLEDSMTTKTGAAILTYAAPSEAAAP